MSRLRVMGFWRNLSKFLSSCINCVSFIQVDELVSRFCIRNPHHEYFSRRFLSQSSNTPQSGLPLCHRLVALTFAIFPIFYQACTPIFSFRYQDLRHMNPQYVMAEPLSDRKNWFLDHQRYPCGQWICTTICTNFHVNLSRPGVRRMMGFLCNQCFVNGSKGTIYLETDDRFRRFCYSLSMRITYSSAHCWGNCTFGY